MLEAIKRRMGQMPAYDLDFFRVDEPKPPAYEADDLYYLVSFNQKMVYDFDSCLARLVDGSEHMEFRAGLRP